MLGFSRTGMVFKLTDPDAHARALVACPARTCSTPPAAGGVPAMGGRPAGAGATSGRRSRTRRSARIMRSRLRKDGATPGHSPLYAVLREPAACLPVAVDAGVLARLEHDLEVAAVDRLLRPPAVDDAPLLPHERRPGLAVHDAAGVAVARGLHERRPRRIQRRAGETASGARPRRYDVTRNDERPRLRDPRPRRHLHHCAHRARPVLALTWRSPSRSRPSELLALRRDERELVADVVGELDRLEPELDDGRGDLRELRPERRAQPASSAVASRSVAVRRQEPPPTSRAETRHLAERPARPLRPCEQPVEQRPERTPQRQLVRDRLGEGERLGQLCRGRSPTHAAALPAAGEAPRPLPLRPQPLRDGAARQPGELAQPPHPEPFELGVAVRRQRQQRERERLEKVLLLLPLDDHRLPGARDARRRERDEPALPRARAWIPGRADGGERPLERRLHPSVEPLDAVRLEDDDARLDRLDREARVLQPAQDAPPTPAPPPPGRARRARASGRSRAPRPAASPAGTPAASAAAVTGPSSGSVPGSGASAAGSSASRGRVRSAARSSKPGMRTQAIMGTLFYTNIRSLSRVA